ncbi:hypothetical protein N7493_007640 [Penicillium malachiteum]|uniref:Ankyrin repeat protein n=1 Tax=Penicillium malachiteum TaxID=1324776 RepID=A0AAD6MU77_9EURO|nr:hypothetical protein N7493_007640 [Penicillium malachiteum]
MAETPMYLAAMQNEVEIAKILIYHGASLDEQEKFGLTPLLAAVSNANFEMVKLLLDNGANVENSDRGQRGPLYLASEEGNVDIVRLLLEHGANVYAKDEKGETSSTYASRNTHWNSGLIRDILIEKEAINQ